MERTLNIATFAVPLSGNKGSASMLFGLRDAFIKANIRAQFAIFSYYPKRDSKIASSLENVSLHSGTPANIFFRLLPLIIIKRLLPKKFKEIRSIATLKRCDVILIIGGTTFADSMLFKVPWNILAALPGYLLRKPTIFLSQTIGPLRKNANHVAARWTLRRALQVHGRGRITSKWVRDLGVEKCKYWPDLSFSMYVPDFDAIAGRKKVAELIREKEKNPDRSIVGIAPNSIVYEKAQRIGIDYLDFLCRAIKYVYNRGFFPVIFPHSYRKDIKKLHNNDRALCQAVVDLLPNDVSCFYLDADLSSAELRSLIGQMDILIASRFHSMISALAMGVPPITYGWGEHKYLEVLEEMGVVELYVPFERISIEGFGPLFETVISRRAELSHRIKNALGTVLEHSERICSEIIGLLN